MQDEPAWFAQPTEEPDRVLSIVAGPDQLSWPLRGSRILAVPCVRTLHGECRIEYQPEWLEGYRARREYRERMPSSTSFCASEPGRIIITHEAERTRWASCRASARRIRRHGAMCHCTLLLACLSESPGKLAGEQIAGKRTRALRKPIRLIHVVGGTQVWWTFAAITLLADALQRGVAVNLRLTLRGSSCHTNTSVAPEAAAEVVVYDLQFSGDRLVQTVERLETQRSDQPLFVSWDVDQPHPYVSIGGGVAFVRGNAFDHYPPAQGEPQQAGPLSFSLRDKVWSHGLMTIVILPAGFTLRSANPAPIAAKPFHERIALFWRPAADKDGQGSISATLDETRGETRRAAHRINAELAVQPATGTEGAIHAEGLRQSTERLALEATNPWRSGLFYLFLLVVVAAVIVGVVLALGTQRLNLYIIGLAILAIMALILLIGALQLRNDRLLSEKNFLSLVGNVFRGFADAVGRGGGRTTKVSSGPRRDAGRHL